MTLHWLADGTSEEPDKHTYQWTLVDTSTNDHWYNYQNEIRKGSVLGRIIKNNDGKWIGVCYLTDTEHRNYEYLGPIDTEIQAERAVEEEVRKYQEERHERQEANLSSRGVSTNN